ncbi:hypothetical protein [Desulfovibrio inopinatus]|uniref:hypothetical protein n=1 Tax=Desulfovibrio inopinatus TaxID=102109 RepID=UPI000485208E|nr:hypothetical protein [Desulfovibrio inopinatus]
MDRPPLTMPEHVRVWRLAGVRSLFVSEETRRAFQAHRKAAAAQAGQSGPVPLRRPDQQHAQSAPPEYAPPQQRLTSTRPAPPSQPSEATLQETVRRPSPVQTPESQSRTTPPHPSPSTETTAAQTTPISNTTENTVWDRYTALLPERPRVIWTYWELGLDLLGKGDPRRGALWRNLRSMVQWPPGFLGFWPLSALQGGTLEAAPQKFLSGIESINPRYILVFGKAGFHALFPHDHFTLGAKPAHGRILQILPDPEELIADEGVAMSRTVHLLRAIHSG